MKTLKTIFVFLFAVVPAILLAQKDEQSNKAEQSCFSAAHFDLVNQYVASRAPETQNSVFIFEGYEVSRVNAQEMHFKKNDIKEAIILRDKGVLAVSKSLDQSREITARIEKVFCHLFAEQKKNK